LTAGLRWQAIMSSGHVQASISRISHAGKNSQVYRKAFDGKKEFSRT